MCDESSRTSLSDYVHGQKRKTVGVRVNTSGRSDVVHVEVRSPKKVQVQVQVSVRCSDSSSEDEFVC